MVQWHAFSREIHVVGKAIYEAIWITSHPVNEVVNDFKLSISDFNLEGYINIKGQ